MGKIKNVPFRVFCYVIVFLFLFIYLFPLFFVANTSLKSAQDYLLHPTALTSTWSFGNYITAWNKANFGAYIGNSILYTGVCTICSLLLSLLIAFPISRKYVPGAGFLYLLFLCGLFLPNGMIPTFQMVLNMGLYDTKIGYMLQPAMVSMGMLSMIGVWNDIVSSTIYLTSESNYNITRGLFVFTGQYSNDWTLTAAGLLVVAAPLILIYIFGQRYIVDGVMAGGLKG